MAAMARARFSENLGKSAADRKSAASRPLNPSKMAQKSSSPWPWPWPSPRHTTCARSSPAAPPPPL
jgi:hypothetical protein